MTYQETISQEQIPPERAGAFLSIDLRALQNNWKQISNQTQGAVCGAAVKADCYGIGLDEPARALAAAGCKIFFVALPDEGARLRKVLADVEIFVLCGLLAGQAGFYQTHNLQPVLATPDQVKGWAEHCSKIFRKLPAGLHIETGINRLGLTEKQTRTLADQREMLGTFNVSLVMSHLACADTPGDAKNDEQRRKFDQLRTLLPDARASLANSPGTFLGSDFSYDIVRPGIGLFGGNPFGDRANPMSAVAHLYAPLLQVRELCAGESVGYGSTWMAKRASRIGVIGTGYRDGLPRSLSSPANEGPACVFIAGHYAPIVGRVSMDLITVDLTDVPAQFAREGGRVELMGANVSVDDLARWSGTLPYEILTRLGSRYARLYLPFDS